MKTILVTGANKGIGFEVSRQLASLGHRVILTARDTDRLANAAGKLQNENLAVTTLILDVSMEENVSSAAATLRKQNVSLDVVINNAGWLDKADKNLLRDPESMLQETISVNSLGPLRVVRSFLPLLNPGARIINISSGGGSMTDPVGGWSPAYCVSKSLLNAITRHLAYSLEDRGISVNAMCPGWVKTEMGGRSAPRSLQRGAETAVWLATTARVGSGKFYRDRKVIPW